LLTKFIQKKYVRLLVFVFLHMLRIVSFLLLVLLSFSGYGQTEEGLASNFRQHNLTTYNASLFNPAFSLDRNNPQSFALWARWQWQAIDANPTTLFLNYSRKLNDRSAAGLAFFQQNTGVFFNTGGALNYAYQFKFSRSVKLALGANVFAFKQELADDRFQIDPNVPLPLPTVTDDFIIQMAPGLSLSVNRLTLSLASENLFDYNFTANEANTEGDEKTLMSLVSYDFPLNLGSAGNAFLRPSLYLRTLPEQSNEIGFNTLLNTNRYWGQLSYNNLYGYGIGVGGTFFKHLSLGALVEFGTSGSLSNETSFELVAAYFLGKPEERHSFVGFDMEEDENALAELEKEQEAEEKLTEDTEKVDKKAAVELAKAEEKQQRKREKFVWDSIAKVEKESAVAAKELQKQLDREAKEKANAEEALAKAEEKTRKRKDEIDTQNREAEAVAAVREKEEAAKRDSIAIAEQAEATMEAQKLKQDSLIAVALEERRVIEAKKKADEAKIAEQNRVDKPKVGEKYEEVVSEAGLLPGYYLIANVFGTKKYFVAFMADMKKKGLQPRAFVRSKNGYNYVYLARYRTLGEARTGRDNKLDGKYPDQTWIFRVVGD